MLKNVCLSVLAGGVSLVTGWQVKTTYEDLSHANREHDVEVVLDDATQDLLAWVDLTADNSAFALTEWMDSYQPDSAEERYESKALLLDPGMSRQQVMAVMGQPAIQARNSDQWSYDSVMVTFENDRVQGWVETNGNPTRTTLRNVMMPLAGVAPPKEVETWIEAGGSKPRIYIKSAGTRQRSFANSLGGAGSHRRTLSRLLDKSFRRVGRRQTSKYKKSAFLQGLYGNRKNSRSSRNKRRNRYYYR